MIALYDPITPVLSLGLWIVGAIVFVVGLAIATRARSRRSDEEPPAD